MQAILDRIVNKTINMRNESLDEICPTGIIDINNWEWAQGVGLYGIYKYYKISGNKEHLDFLIDWYDRHLEEEIEDKNINTTAPFLTLAFLYEETQNERYLQACKSWAEIVYNDFPRTEENGFQHKVSGEENHGQLWADTLFMTVLFLAKIGMVLGREDYIEEAKYQFLLHIKYLVNTKTGLWYHGWNFNGRTNFAEAQWGRGNCWYTIGVIELIEIIKLEGGIKDYLLSALDSQLDALADMQSSEGGWHTLLDKPDSYLEVSATAGFAAGIIKGIRLGLVDKKYQSVAKKAIAYILRNIDDDGVVQNVSYGTGMGSDLEHYMNIPICPMTYGQALALLCLTEAQMCGNEYLD